MKYVTRTIKGIHARVEVFVFAKNSTDFIDFFTTNMRASYKQLMEQAEREYDLDCRGLRVIHKEVIKDKYRLPVDKFMELAEICPIDYDESEEKEDE